ncbi:hypothetical protein M409DRAFT_21894 [Zasmidium cellare ATCC 36951]|uniref:Uncharacterized protein n=1 Tax=Zasmidium cellare ATCC 36951 TaxID=1080233 RepID=A0A6A6CMA1_ZASCE|nr:uncharacterized protein M409DRAFT_21894 [Zasmidium cellare ATCC 36951]KAF2167743.1 hypothetical protein M409DRAFT_21894 [Zasmidium cellare ATCC 36951]
MPRPRRPFSKARPRKELLAQIQRAQRMREMEGQAVQEEHVAITIAAEDPLPPPPPRARPFSKARPRKELLAQIQRAQEMRHLEQQENIPPVESVEEQLNKRTTFDKFVDQLDEEGRVPKASHPQSALEALLNEEGREYNDSTIASLENIIHPVMDTPPQSQGTEDPATNETTPAPSRRHRSEEIVHEDVLASLSKQLYTTQSTIKDANRGLRRISNKIEGSSPSKADLAPRVEEPPAAIKNEPPVEVVPQPKDVPKAETAVKKTTERNLERRTDPKIASKTKNPPPDTVARQKITPQVDVSIPTVDSSNLDHNGKTICTHCGGRYASVWRALWVEFRENFYTYDPKSRFHIHMTRLGWITAAFLMWLIIESSLCLTWCSTTYGPMMPFVTHYVILEPFRPYVKPYWRFLGWVLDTIFNLENGEVPGGRSVPSHTLAAAAATARATKRVVRSAVDAVDEMGSMWNDEFI